MRSTTLPEPWPLDRRRRARAARCRKTLYAAAVANGLVADDGARQCWATIRSGLSKGLLRPVDLDADAGPRGRRRRWKGEQP